MSELQVVLLPLSKRLHHHRSNAETKHCVIVRLSPAFIDTFDTVDELLGKCEVGRTPLTKTSLYHKNYLLDFRIDFMTDAIDLKVFNPFFAEVPELEQYPYVKLEEIKHEQSNV